MSHHRVRRVWSVLASAAALAAAAAVVSGAPGSLKVDVAKPGPVIQPSLYGIFFEEINYAGDGGIYAELLRNRNFEEPGEQPAFWGLVLGGDARGKISVNRRGSGGEHNTHSLIIEAFDVSKGRVGAVNDGYWGIPLTKGAKYKLGITALARAGTTLRVTLENRAGEVYAEQQIRVTQAGADDLNIQEVELTSSATDPNARLVLSLERPGRVAIDYVSLFPVDTFKGRANGLRKDLAEKLAAMRPGFMRFPGGCWVEGDTMATASRWKRTIGPLPERWTQQNLWGYYSTNGLGYHEYLQMAEDLGADALFVVNCGMSHRETVPMDKMDEFVQDALDAIEYAVGPADSRWGSQRAKAGHPEPFKLKYVQVGNENGGPRYDERYALFYDAISKRYPDIKIIANLWNGIPRSRPIQILDEHYYNTPQFFFRNANRYDTYDRNGFKVYVGEYAVTRGSGAGNHISALGEAAFMTGMERNADVVVMSSYAPLFTHVSGKRWNPDLINFDSARSYGTPSYHVQTMFAQNRGDVVLPVQLTPAAASTTQPAQKLAGAAGVATWRTRAEFKDFKVVGPDGKTLYATDFANREGWRGIGGGQGPGGAALPDAAVAQGQTGGGGPAGRWAVRDNMLVSLTEQEDVSASVGDVNWTDYTVHVKARKTAGNEGFIIAARHENDQNYIWFNVGGWENSRTGIERNRDGEKTEIARSADFTVETGRWYDVRLEVKGEEVKGYIDDKLIVSGKDTPAAATPMLFATASRENQTGDVIVKVVNGGAEPQEMAVSLEGATLSASTAKATVLTGDPQDENTVDAPTKVAPRTVTIDKIDNGNFTHTFPKHSVTVIRVPGK